MNSAVSCLWKQYMIFTYRDRNYDWNLLQDLTHDLKPLRNNIKKVVKFVEYNKRTVGWKMNWYFQNESQIQIQAGIEIFLGIFKMNHNFTADVQFKKFSFNKITSCYILTGKPLSSKIYFFYRLICKHYVFKRPNILRKGSFVCFSMCFHCKIFLLNVVRWYFDYWLWGNIFVNEFQIFSFKLFTYFMQRIIFFLNMLLVVNVESNKITQ